MFTLPWYFDNGATSKSILSWSGFCAARKMCSLYAKRLRRTEGAMWHVVHTMSGREESAMEKCRVAVGETAKRFILPKCQFNRRCHGESKLIENVAFPGYFFIDSDTPKELEKMLSRIPGVVTPVRIGGGFNPIRKEEEDVLLRMMNENDLIEASVGNVVDGKLIVDEGPLKGLEGRVRKYERHDRWADVEMPLFEVCKSMKVGLQVVAKMTAEEYQKKKTGF